MQRGVIFTSPHCEKRVWIAVDKDSRADVVEEAEHHHALVTIKGRQIVLKDSFDEVLKRLDLMTVESAVDLEA